MSDEPCVCEHDEAEHTTTGCASWTPTWPRLVRCPCREFCLDRIASDASISVDESVASEMLDDLGEGIE